MSLALVLIAVTAPVAPACNVNPRAKTKMPGMKSAWEPSMRMPMRPSRYGGAVTAAPRAAPIALAVSLSRLERVTFRPMRVDGTAT